MNVFLWIHQKPRHLLAPQTQANNKLYLFSQVKFNLISSCYLLSCLGLNQNSSSRKKVVSESTSSNPSSNSSLSSSRSSMSSLSSDALTVNNNYKASLNEMYFNNTNFKLDSKCKEKYQASCSHSNSIKRKFSDELIKSKISFVSDYSTVSCFWPFYR